MPEKLLHKRLDPESRGQALYFYAEWVTARDVPGRLDINIFASDLTPDFEELMISDIKKAFREAREQA